MSTGNQINQSAPVGQVGIVSKCKVADSTCVYHACMSEECQRDIVKSQGSDWGKGKCELNGVDLYCCDAGR